MTTSPYVCQLFASSRASSQSGKAQLSFRWLNPQAATPPLLPPLLTVQQSLTFEVVATPGDLVGANMTTALSLVDLQPGSLTLTVQPTVSSSATATGSNPISGTIGSPGVVVPLIYTLGATANPSFTFELTLVHTPTGGTSVTYIIDPEMVVGLEGPQ